MSPKIILRLQVIISVTIPAVSSDEIRDDFCPSVTFSRGKLDLAWNFNKSSIPINVASWIANSSIHKDYQVTQSKIVGQSQLSWQGLNKVQLNQKLWLNGFLYGMLDHKESLYSSIGFKINLSAASQIFCILLPSSGPIPNQAELSSSDGTDYGFIIQPSLLNFITLILRVSLPVKILFLSILIS